MSRYKRKPAQPRSDVGADITMLLGMLYIVEVRMVRASTEEKLHHRLLMVGCEAEDIERKLKWIFDPKEYREFSINGVEKVREKVHFLSTKVTQQKPEPAAVIDRGPRSQAVSSLPGLVEAYDPNLYAVAISTTMMAKDGMHALRKVGRALILQGIEGRSHSGPLLSEESTVTVEEIPKSSGYAKSRDVSAEINNAHFVRG